MIVNYETNRKLIWTEEGRVSFHLIKKAINECPTLFFLSDTGQIVLYTDASDYGIGAYCCQEVDGVWQHVAFMSKLLSAQEIRWSTIEKEAYAIVYILKKFEYLLRDRKFLLKTVHKNLIYIDKELNAKVKRWKIMIQEYEFDIGYIEGPKNFVADAMSRLIELKMSKSHF
jgi:hypothetical protein